MIREYIPVLLQIIVAVGFAVSALVVSVLLGQSGLRQGGAGDESIAGADCATAVDWHG